MERKKITDTYKIIRKIGSGSFGRVYVVKHNENQKPFAIKVEKVYQSMEEKNKNIVNSPLYNEFLLYQVTKNRDDIAIPKVYTYYKGTSKEVEYEVEKDKVEKGYEFYIYLVMDLVGPNLGMLHKKRDFGIAEVCDIGYQLLVVLEKLHKLGYVHRDIKPENIAYGIEKNEEIEDEKGQYKMTKKVYLLDFGLVKKWRHAKGGSAVGTARYMSINVHQGLPYSRKDDLESLGYILIYLLSGYLPWQGFKAPTKEEHMVMIKESKIKSKINLCEALPPSFEKYMFYCWSLESSDEPNYIYMRNLFSVVPTNKATEDKINLA
jgi:serine/threonine protein kinase